MTAKQIAQRADEIDEQNSRMAGLVVSICIALISTSGLAIYLALKLT